MQQEMACFFRVLHIAGYDILYVGYTTVDWEEQGHTWKRHDENASCSSSASLRRTSALPSRSASASARCLRANTARFRFIACIGDREEPGGDGRQVGTVRHHASDSR